MLNENAKKWVAALRSGEFKQGGYALRRRAFREGLALKDGESPHYVTVHCCLGVACEIFKDELDLEVTQGEGDYADTTYYDDSNSMLPLKVKRHLRLKNVAGSHHHGLMDLTILNDRECRTFAEIADLIESEPEGLFEPPWREVSE